MINETNKTAVEWLYEKLFHCEINIFEWQNYLEQAKAMHKEEIKEAFNQGYRDGAHDASDIPLSIGDISEYNNAEIHYNETYGGNK